MIVVRAAGKLGAYMTGAHARIYITHHLMDKRECISASVA